MDLWVKNLLRKKLDLEKFQRPNMDIESAINYLEESQKNGDVLIIASQASKIIFILRYESPWTAELDLVADTKGSKKLYVECKKINDWFWKNYSHVHKLQMQTTNEKLGTFAEKIGWTKEGIKKESYIDFNTMKYKDEFLYGLINPNH